MPVEVGSISARIVADTKPIQAAFGEAVGEARVFKSNFQRSLHDLGGKESGESFLRGLKHELGKSSELGLALKTAMGSGAIAALSIASHLAVELTENLKKAREAGDFGALVTAVPIFGSLVKSAGNLYEVLFPISGELEHMKKTAEALEAIEKSFLATTREGADALRGLAQAREKSLTAAEGGDVEHVAIRQQLDIEKDPARKLEESAAKNREKANSLGQKQLEEKLALQSLAEEQEEKARQIREAAEKAYTARIMELNRKREDESNKTANEEARKVEEAKQREVDAAKRAAEAQAEAIARTMHGTEGEIVGARDGVIAKQLFDFKSLAGVTGEQVAAYEQMLGKLQQVKDAQDMGKEIDRWRESIKGPIQQYDEAIAKIRKWRDEGKITQEEFQQGVAAAKDDLERNEPTQRENGRSEAKFASFIRAGSADALRLQSSLSRDSQEIPRKQLAKLDEQKRIQEEIRDRLDFEEV
jgi:hypothetical protein